MKNAVPIMSPLLSYDRRGAVVVETRRKRPNSLNAQRLRAVGRLRGRRQLSRDLSSPTHPPAPLVRLLPLLACLTGCAAIHEQTSPQYFVLTLPASVVLIVLLSVAYGFACGVGIGTSAGTKYLRAADSAAAQYHRAGIAEILDRSSVVHQLVHDIIATADIQITQLRWELEALKEAHV